MRCMPSSLYTPLVLPIDNSGNVSFISRQVRERVIKSSLSVETRPIVGKRVETEYTIRIFNNLQVNLVLLLRP